MRLFGILLALLLTVLGCSQKQNASTDQSGEASPSRQEQLTRTAPEHVPTTVEKSAYKTTASGLMYAILKKSDGRQPRPGDRVVVHYRGWLLNGKEFDSSYRRNKPWEFTLLQDPVIKGWEEGIQLLHEGEKAQFIIPSRLGYGQHGYPPLIPPDATLVFEIELIKVYEQTK